jgi:mycoredoxin-dependent peroxiredoxin
MATELSLFETPTLKVGDEAPDFTLRSQYGVAVSLSSYRRQKNVLLVFFPNAFSPVCSTQLPHYQAELPRFIAGDTRVLGISMDSTYALRRWSQDLGIDFALLSDFYPQGRVTDLYGLRQARGMPERALILVDKCGRIAWIHVQRPTDEVPSEAELFEILQRLADQQDS